MNRQLHRNLFDTFLYNPLTPFFKGELSQLLHYLKIGKLFFNNLLELGKGARGCELDAGVNTSVEYLAQ